MGPVAQSAAVGHALDWHRSGWGTFREEVPHFFSSREVVAIGPMTDVDAANAAPAWEQMRLIASNLLNGAGRAPGCDALELRYVTEPGPGRPTRVRMFLTAMTRGWGPELADGAVEAACAALPACFSWGHPTVDLGHGTPVAEEVIELRRGEGVTFPQWAYIPAEYYYAITDAPGDGSGWAQFWALLGRVTQRVEISILLLATELDGDERDALAGITTQLALVSEPRMDFDIVGNQVAYPGDTNAAAALESWNARLAALHRPFLGRVAVRGELGTAGAIASALAAAIASRRTALPGSHPMYVEAPASERDRRQAAHGFAFLEILPWGGSPLWQEQDLAPHRLRRLPYLWGVDEAAGLAVLPVPDRDGVPGFVRGARGDARRSAIDSDPSTEPGISLGDIRHLGQAAGPAVLPVSAINQHLLVAGSPGWGKTTTVQSVLVQLWRDHGIPFLVVEPRKREYRGLLDVAGVGDDLHVICLGRDDLSPLRLNPLEPPPGVRREVHQGTVLRTLKLALPLFPPLPQLLDDAIDRAYERAGWDYDTTIEAGLTPPTLRTLRDAFASVFEQEGYTGEARNLGVALGVRLKNLTRGSRGRVFDAVETTDFADLLARPTVIELDAVHDEADRAIYMAFLVEKIRAAASHRGSTGNRLRHVTVLEEAHLVLSASPTPSGQSGEPDARSEAVRELCEAIALLRAQGEGFVLSSQRPSSLAPDAVANTSTRLLHHTLDAADREKILADWDAGDDVRELAARLARGELLGQWPGRHAPEWIAVRPEDDVDTGREVSDDRVGLRMRHRTEATHRQLPFTLCSREVCTGGCVPSRRAEGEAIARDLSASARSIWRSSERTLDALAPLASLVTREADADVPQAYCAAVHLHAAGDAFTVRRRVDIRRDIERAIRTAGEASSP